MIKIIENKGFQMTFSNGWTVSVLFGKHDCSNNIKFAEVSANTAEVSAWDKDDNWYKFDCERSGWKTPNEVQAFINMIALKEDL